MFSSQRSCADGKFIKLPDGKFIKLPDGKLPVVASRKLDGTDLRLVTWDHWQLSVWQL